MHLRFKRITAATAFVLALAIGQMYLPLSLAASAGDASASPQQATAILTTAGNKPIIVNGASAISGATVLTGAELETPDQIGASVNLPGHFSLDIAPRAKVSITFDQSGIKVNLIRGCVVLHTNKGTTGEIDTARGVAAKADGSKDDRLEVCDRTAVVPTGLSTGAKIAIIAAIIGGVALIPILTGGTNPSNGAPR